MVIVWRKTRQVSLSELDHMICFQSDILVERSLHGLHTEFYFLSVQNWNRDFCRNCCTRFIQYCHLSASLLLYLSVQLHCSFKVTEAPLSKRGMPIQLMMNHALTSSSS
ncbi:hypothetical protein RchiOBHm_Chr7g0210701 [Rosa chinensis]|uniref:Uncharacterized protein n=1 Tax=Rosa chinensis TaxID=74649 RepID=A0A2P6PAA8_ROSCH|nr:hypothetical protein RchiOBHm_Chr7g0210701 [Rosa chinensis]